MSDSPTRQPPPDYTVNLLIAAKNSLAALGDRDDQFVEELMDAVVTFEEMIPTVDGVIQETVSA